MVVEDDTVYHRSHGIGRQIERGTRRRRETLSVSLPPYGIFHIYLFQSGDRIFSESARNGTGIQQYWIYSATFELQPQSVGQPLYRIFAGVVGSSERK